VFRFLWLAGFWCCRTLGQRIKYKGSGLKLAYKKPPDLKDKQTLAHSLFRWPRVFIGIFQGFICRIFPTDPALNSITINVIKTNIKDEEYKPINL